MIINFAANFNSQLICVVRSRNNLSKSDGIYFALLIHLMLGDTHFAVNDCSIANFFIETIQGFYL